METTSQDGNWIRTNERQELVQLCEFTAKHAQSPTKDLSTWRWLIVGSVMSLQGACVCAIDGADINLNNVFQKTNKRAQDKADALADLSALNPSKPPSKERLASPSELLRRVQKPEYLPHPHTASVSTRISRDIRKLIGFRNGFIHFGPHGWAIETAGLPRMIDSCWNIIEQLIVLRPTFNRHLSTDQKKQLLTTVSLVRSTMKELGISE